MTNDYGTKATEHERDFIPDLLPEDYLKRLDEDVQAVGGAWEEPPEYHGSVGRTMFDTPSSQDNTVTVLLPRDYLDATPSQALLRIKSVEDGRSYLGVVVAGPFAEPDGLRGDAPMIVTTTVKGGIFLPKYHGRVQVELLGEEVDGVVVPPRFRPRPNSPVFVVDHDEAIAIMRVAGDIKLGLAVGYEKIEVGVPLTKSVLPRHTGILGTTGGGKSTTVSGLIAEAQANGFTVIVLDVEGEYTQISEPTEDPAMIIALSKQQRIPRGVPNVGIYHLVGRETSNPIHPERHEFSLMFSRLSPFALKEILDLSDPQELRFMRAYDVSKQLLRSLGVFPRRGNREDEEILLELDEYDRGYPELTLSHIIDVAGAMLHVAEARPGVPTFYNRVLQNAEQHVMQAVRASRPDHASSWRALLARLWQLHRLHVFDNRDAEALDYRRLLEPGRVSIIDLSDTQSPQLNNLVIADILRGIQREQDQLYEAYERGQGELPKVLIIIEEAHEFLSAERVEKMPVLFEQVARIAKRGRKRWLGLIFVTQMPHHLPRQLLGLLNNYILHKITDPLTINALERSISGIDDSLWKRLPGLAPGQAIISFTHMARPLLVAIHPTPCKLRLVD